MFFSHICLFLISFFIHLESAQRVNNEADNVESSSNSAVSELGIPSRVKSAVSLESGDISGVLIFV